MGRALAHARGAVPGFHDPYALRLLPAECREAVEGRLRGALPRSPREAILRVVAASTEALMGPRTVEIDGALREMPAGHQLVILGAGLDARAYRLSALADSVVFEVDHPASQAFKRRQTASLTPTARELRHVPVDFARETWSSALERAGHSPRIPTAWVFEGVISYLSPEEVEASLDAIAELSAPGSRLCATYNEDSALRRLFAAVTARSGEPQRACFTRAAMKALLVGRGFVVRSESGWDRTCGSVGAPRAAPPKARRALPPRGGCRQGSVTSG